MLHGQSATSLNCALVGDTKNARVQALNLRKNRTTTPKPADFDTAVTMVAFLKPGQDAGRFDTRMAAHITGYVTDVKVGGVESVNCHAKAAPDRDTHIELTLTPNNLDEGTHVIVEVTPRWRAVMAQRGEDWSTPALRRSLLGRWIAVEGWLLYDQEHEANATNTQRGRAKLWRATVWEVHPVTAIKVGVPPPRPSR